MRLILVLLACLFATQAQEIRSVNGTPTLRVHGQSTVSVQPDQADLDIGVTSPGKTAKAASDLNAARTNAVSQALRQLVPKATIETINFSVNPNYRFPKDGGEAEILGYSADSTVRIAVDDISLVRKLIDAATRAGATNINRLDFTLRDEKPVRARALADAASQAEAGAEALAASLKLKVGKLLQVEEGQPVVVSPARQIDLEKLRATNLTPISPGNIEVHADVDLTYEITGQSR